MNSSWRLVRIFGIEIRIHATFLLVVAWAMWNGWRLGGGVGAALWMLAFVLAVFACVVLHELGHSLVAIALGIPVRRITLLPIGGVAGMARLPEQPRQELLITIAGPLVNVLIAAGLLLARGGWPAWTELAPVPVSLASLLDLLLLANVVLAVFNLLPAFPMDGGRLLRSLLSFFLPRATATAVAAALGQVLAVGLALLGATQGNPFLVVMGVFLIVVARGEARMTDARELLRGLPAHAVMRRDLAALAPGDPIERCAALNAASGQEAFPVLADGRLVGLLNRRDWQEPLRLGLGGDAVAHAMQRGFAALQPDTDVSALLPRLATRGQDLYPVLADGRLAGFVTRSALVRLLHGESSPPRPGARRTRWTLDVGR